MKRSPMPPRKSRIPRVNRQRRKSEFARCYHSKERVLFVKGLGCLVCTAIAPIFGIVSAGESHNAHTSNEGKGRKGHYTTIIPLCASHHRRYDEHLPPCNSREIREVLKICAAGIEEDWRSHLAEDAA
jgi:hypothetical protein